MAHFCEKTLVSNFANYFASWDFRWKSKLFFLLFSVPIREKRGLTFHCCPFFFWLFWISTAVAQNRTEKLEKAVHFPELDADHNFWIKFCILWYLEKTDKPDQTAEFGCNCSKININYTKNWQFLFETNWSSLIKLYFIQIIDEISLVLICLQQEKHEEKNHESCAIIVE